MTIKEMEAQIDRLGLEKLEVRLSKGEQEVVKLYLNGCTLDYISQQLHKNRSTVKTQLLRVRDKLGVKNCREIIRVMRLGGYML